MKRLGQLALTVVATFYASGALALPQLDIDVDTSLSGIQTNRVVTVGTVFDVEIHISGVSALFAYDIDVDHDPAILDATGVTEGPFLPSGGSTFFSGDDSGNPVNALATLIGAIPGVSGDGGLFTIQYSALAKGINPLQFTWADLVDEDLGQIALNLNGASVTVQGVPLPSTLLLFGVGLGVIAGLRRQVK